MSKIIRLWDRSRTTTGSWLFDLLGKEPDNHFVNRFWSKVECKKDNECWFWLSYVGPRGYGQFQVKKNVPRHAHRVALALTKGIEPYMLACHTCDVRKCCNPNHLYVGTPLSNMDDMISRGRAVHNKMRGRSWSKITLDTARYIRDNYKKIPTTDLSIKFNLSEEHIRRIGRREVWDID